MGFVVTWGTLPGENAPSGTLALPGSCCWKHVVGSFRLPGSAQHGVTCEALNFLLLNDFLYVNVLFSNTCMIWHQKPSLLCAVGRLK